MRIALIKPSALGDICHALPALVALRRAQPMAHITWIVNDNFEPLIAAHPDLNATFPFDRGAFRRPLSAVSTATALLNRLRRERFDTVIDLQGLLRTGLMTTATGAPVKIGFANAREGAAQFYTHPIAIPDANHMHATDRYLRVIQSLGGSTASIEYRLPVDAVEREQIQSRFGMHPRPWIAVAVGAKWVTKRWPPRHFGTLLQRVEREFGGTAFFIGTADDTADALTAMSFLRPHAMNLCGQTKLPTLAALLAACDAMIGNDTGPLHLAVALGRPVIAPYLCTIPVRHGPYGQTGGIASTVSCAGSYRKACPHNYVCFDELTPDRLWPATHEVLSQWRRD
jgi:heptosyltransferase I